MVIERGEELGGGESHEGPDKLGNRSTKRRRSHLDSNESQTHFAVF
jgi:hypothetical protein